MRAQLLDAPRPTELLTVVQQLTLLQIDPTAAVAPTADLVAWSRLGSAYDPDELKQALEQDRTLFELDAMVRPMSDLGPVPVHAIHEDGPRGSSWPLSSGAARRAHLERAAQVPRPAA